MMAGVALSLMMGSLLLFHFTQVFPWRRPWIRAHLRWLAAGYVVVPIAVAVPAWLFRGLDMAGPGGVGGGGGGPAAGTGALVLPLLFFRGFCLPPARSFA